MINHKHRFIYTKISKTASGSIHGALKNIEGKKTHCNHYHILDDINQRTKDYFKFTFVRNPWERLVSKYFYARRRKRKHHQNYLEGNSTFAEFAKSKGPPYGPNDTRKFSQQRRKLKHSPTLVRLFDQKSPYDNQLDWISDHDGNVLVDFIGRFENLQGDFNTLCDKIGIPQQNLPYKNKSKHKHYTEYYDEESRQIVAEKFARDIEYFGHEFGG